MFSRGRALGHPNEHLETYGNQQHAAASVQEGSSNTASTVAAIRGQQQQARRASGGPAAPSLADLRSSRASQQAPARSRVQQTPSSSAADSADGSSQSISKSLRSRLMPLAAAAPKAKPAAAQNQGAAAPAAGLSAQLFSVFTNPLSSAGAADAKSSGSGQHSRSRAAAAIPAAESPDHQEIEQPQQEAQHAVGADNPPAKDATAASAAGAINTEAADALQACSTSYSTDAGKASMQQDGLQRTYCFEVQAAGSEPEQLIDYREQDQHGDDMFGPDGQIQQLGGSIQQYVYDEDTGQLCRTGEGAETTRVGRHYLEDCHTGEFFQLAQQPTGGLWAWLRRRPRLGPDGWFGGVGGPGDMQQQEPGFLHSLSDFLDTMGSGMAALGLFAQGLAGGLALLCLFMTHIQYATAGREGFLAFYSPQAEMINRTFFTLISISLVAAAARHAYDHLGHFRPRNLRLGVVDCLVMLLYFLAYTCNLLATPLDDQLAFEARRDAAFCTLPLPAAFEKRLGLWHALNLVRVVTCGLAWVLVCYRSNHFIMLKVFEARKAEQEEEEQRYIAHTHAQGAVTAGGVAAGAQAAAVGSAGGMDASRRLVRLGSNLQGSFADRGAGGGLGSTQQQQQQWAVPARRFSGGGAAGCGLGSCPGGVGSPGQGWAPDQRR